jgi:hypothetical protein
MKRPRYKKRTYIFRRAATTKHSKAAKKKPENMMGLMLRLKN